MLPTSMYFLDCFNTIIIINFPFNIIRNFHDFKVCKNSICFIAKSFYTFNQLLIGSFIMVVILISMAIPSKSKILICFFRKSKTTITSIYYYFLISFPFYLYLLKLYFYYPFLLKSSTKLLHIQYLHPTGLISSHESKCL